MDEIKSFISQYSESLPKKIRRRSSLILLKGENFDLWLKSILIAIRQCKYREAIRIIESKKNLFYHYNNSWKYEIYEIHCILKIIKKKLFKYPKEILNNNPHQNKSILFWFNQVFYILEILILNLRPDINKNKNLNEEENINRIEYIVQAHLKTLYYLCLYSKLIGEIPQLCTYFAMTERFKSYILYTRQPKTLHLLQKILLLRANILIQNLDFENCLKYQKLSMDICFREFFLLVDFDTGLNIDHLSCSKKNKNYIYKNIINMTLAFYLRGVCFEIYGNLNKSIEAYKQSRWLCDKFLQLNQPEFYIFINNIEKRAFIYFYIINDINEEIKNIKDEKIEKEKIKRKKIELAGIEEKQNEEILKKISSGQSTVNFGNLENVLENIGNHQLKDLENEKHLLGKSKKSKFILSTMTMINNLLSEDFNDILYNMKKIEINKMDKKIKSSIHRRLEDIENNKSHIIKNKSLIPNLTSRNSNLSPNNKSKFIIKIKSPSNSPLNKKKDYLFKSFENKKDKSLIKKKLNKIKHLNWSLSKNCIEKKLYLENLSRKEIDFHKKNLYAKRFEIDPDVGTFDKKKINNNAENNFNLKLIFAQFQARQKTKLKSIIKENLLNNKISKLHFSNQKLNYEPLTPTLRESSRSKMSFSSQSFILNLKNNKSQIKVDKQSINSSNFDIIKQLNKETENINKSIAVKNKLYKSCSAVSIKPKDKMFHKNYKRLKKK